jgi:hypothetical protein
MKKFFENKPRAWFVIGALLTVLATAGTTTYLLINRDNTDPNILARVGDQNITQENLDEQLYGMGFLDDISIYTEEEKSQLLSFLVEKSIIKQKASQLGISATEIEINDAISKGLETKKDAGDGLKIFSNYTEKQKLITRDNTEFEVLKLKVKERTLAWNSGSFLVFRFDKYNADIPEEYRFKTSGSSDYQTKRQALKELALQKANYYREKLEQGIPFLKVRDEAAQDVEIGYPSLVPQSPFLSGVVTKNDYYSDTRNLNLPGNSSFNDSLFKVAIGKVSEPFIIKDDSGKDLDYYVLYQSNEKKDGYKWGYYSWLTSEKERLITTKSSSEKQSFLNSIFTNHANAAYLSACGTSDHFYRFTIDFVYKNRSNVDVRIANHSLKINTGWSNAFCNGSYFEGYYRTDYLTSNHEYLGSSGSTGRLSVGMRDDASALSTNGYVDCNQTTRFYITNADGPVTIEGASGGSWSVTNSIPTNAYIMDDNAGWYTTCLNNDTSAAGKGRCTSTEATATANGTTGSYIWRYSPNWINNYALTVAKNGTGTGAVVGSEIDCGTDCSHTWPQGTVVDLTATPSSGSSFASWSGCDSLSGTGNNVCRVTLNSSRTVTATFNHVPVPALSCATRPSSGLSPLVINTTVTASDLSSNVFDYKFQKTGGTEEIILGRGSNMYYTLYSAGTYESWVRSTSYLSNQWVLCNPPTVEVNNPSGADGGEVAP